MIHRLSIRTAPLLLLALGWAGMAHAEGEDAGFSFHPSIEFSNVYDGNPGLGRHGTRSEGDFAWWITPRAELGWESPEIELGADLAMDLRRYVHTDELADEFWYASGFAEVGLLPGLTTRIANAFEPHYLQLGLPEDHGANLAQTNRVDGELRYWSEVGRSAEVEIGGRGSYFVSESFPAMFPSAGGPVEVWGYEADFWQASGFVQSQTPIGRGTTALMNTEVGYRDYQDGRRDDHMNVSATAGVRSERFENLELELQAGYGLISFDHLGDVHQPIGRLSLSQQLPRGFAWHGLVANRFRSNLIGNEVFEATGEIGVEKTFQEVADASVDLFVAHFEDRGEPSNLYGGVEVEAGRNLAAQTRLSLKYRYWLNAGEAGFDDMSQNSVFLTFTHRR